MIGGRQSTIIHLQFVLLPMLVWVQEHGALLGWLGMASVLMFVGSLVVLPWLVIRIPTDYFVHRRHWADRWEIRHPLLRLTVLVVKNMIGVVLVLAGVAMLVLPGQGILTILIGLMCLDFPGKYALEQYIARQRPVIGALNWIRLKAHRPPLELRD
jgi:hypothetical protein